MSRNTLGCKFQTGVSGVGQTTGVLVTQIVVDMCAFALDVDINILLNQS
jgi:hypothetical protein